MKIIAFISIVISCLLSSCSTVQTSIAPVLNSQNEMVVMVPHSFKVTPNTKGSKRLALMENIVEDIPKEFPTSILNINEENDEKARSILHIFSGDGKLKSGKTIGFLIPVIDLKTQNIDRERIDAAMPKIMKTYYRKLSKFGKMVPSSDFQKKPETKES